MIKFHTSTLQKSSIFVKYQNQAVDRHESITILAPPGMGKTLTLHLLAKKLPNSLYIDLNGRWEKNIPTDKPLIIILDHAENLSDQLYFKSIRESARDKIVFIFAISGKTIPTGPLEPVLLENIINLEPLNSQDAKIFLEKCERLFQGKLTPNQKQEILDLGNGVPRLIKRLCKLFLDNLDPDTDLKFQKDLQEVNNFFGKNTGSTETIGKIQFNETLSKQEYLLAKLLIEKGEQLVTREEMIEAIWKNQQYDVNDHALDQMLHRLRKKLSSASPKCELEVYRGRGVKLIT